MAVKALTKAELRKLTSAHARISKAIDTYSEVSGAAFAGLILTLPDLLLLQRLLPEGSVFRETVDAATELAQQRHEKLTGGRMLELEA